MHPRPVAGDARIGRPVGVNRGGPVKRLPAASSPQRGENATAGVYGARLRLGGPVLLFGVVLAVYLWRRGAAWCWPELVWYLAALLQLAIRWPHVEANRANRVARSRVSRLEQWLMFGVFLTLLGLPMFYLATPWLDALNYQLPSALPMLAAGMMAASLWLFYLAHAHLGRQWSPSLEVHAEHRLVTEGVYRLVRHPMYASIWLFALAQPLLIQNAVAGALAVPGFALLYFLRVPREEALMLDTFGDEYRAYMRRAGRVLPRLGG
ncbi:protein-S-isoprenylcysteine O-methyltransferase [Aquabacterium sp. A7-Y]|uniref:protein-S-isoprenylcysteine O-methyltransferase n=1 Tax=Aquabacterium sp. A7-Y TaxID=1349605 RepID=UPI00223D3D6D|nr:protein-S-isoprenylcysteine O-methyltransferase [Aquabacterium sp. A7-Y]MCW7540777.1 protein-S-isoprenylcysteine O-methyltransferase [Aquabacterium sp. A7-Y]